MTHIFKSVNVDVDVEIEIDFSDVCDFIDDASDETLEAIAEKLAKKNIECHPLTEFDPSTVRHLIERANIFGIKDMMDDLKREGERVGAYLRVEVKS